MKRMGWIAGMLTALAFGVSTPASRAGDPVRLVDHGSRVQVQTLAYDGHAETIAVGWHGGHHRGWYGHGHGWYRGYGWRRPWGWYARPWLPDFVAIGGPFCDVAPPVVYGAPSCGIATAVLNIVGAVLANRPYAQEYVIQPPPRTVLPPPTPVMPPSAAPPPIPPQEGAPSTGQPREAVPLPQAVPSKPAPQPTLLQRLAARRAARQFRRQLRQQEHQDTEPARAPETERVTLRERREPKP